MISNFLWVGIGGFAGSVLRYAMAVLFANLGWSAGRFPIATLAVNLLGSMLIGVMIRNLEQGSVAFLVGSIGFCGGFTTFSTFSFEVIKLLKQGDLFHAAFYSLISLVVCTVAVLIGLNINIHK